MNVFGLTTKKSGIAGFDYCFWGKLLVAIPAVPIVGIIAAAPFSEPDTKIVAAMVGCGVAVCLASWVDHLPALSNKIFQRR